LAESRTSAVVAVEEAIMKANMEAFGNSATCKQAVMKQLRQLERVGQWVYRPIFWDADAQAGSFVGNLLRGSDLDQWRDQLGLPKWLALLIDSIWLRAPDKEEGSAAAVTIINVVETGTDISKVGNRIVLRLLDDLTDGLRGFDMCEDLSKLVADVTDLHRRCVKKGDIPIQEWRQVRRVATTLVKDLAAGSVDAALGACVEAAVWDPRTSRTAVSDTLHYWLRAKLALALRDYGWSSEDDAHIKSLLDALHAQAIVATPDVSIDVFKLLEQHHPEEATRLKARIAYEKQQSAVHWRRALRIVTEELREGENMTEAPLIPRAHLFANPPRAGMQISPDGHWLAWLANGDGVMNIWAAPRAHPEQQRQVTFDRHRGVHGFSWTYVPGLLLYAQDQDGDENWQIHAADVVKGEQRTLTPVENGVRANIFAISRKLRDRVLITMNKRDPRYPDLYSLDLFSGVLQVLEENSGFAQFLTDDDFRVRMAMRSTPLGGMQLLTRDNDLQWQVWLEFSPEDARTSGPTHFSADGKLLYLRDSRGRDTTALTAIDIATGKVEVLAGDARADIGGTINDPVSYRPLAYGVTYERYRMHVLDESIRADVDFLDAQDIGEWGLSSRTEDNRLWLVSASSDIRPSATWLYDRKVGKLSKLYDVRPDLAEAPLARMQAVTIVARDGLKLVSYLTRPCNRDFNEQPIPLVLHVHGGPWARDHFGYNATHQWLANRGYAVLSVNFRSSTGFGKSFIRAGNGEWGRKMDEDLEDAVQWAVDQGIADPKRLAIFGASYGGFAVLSALSRYSHRYACGIDVVGPSNLQTLLASVPSYWESARAMQHQAIGNPETPEGRALLHARSPLHRAKSIRVPLLIAQGANDPRVKQAESEQMVKALKDGGVSVVYALYPDEGHGFVREPNRMSFNALVESFLARHLGGRDEGWSEGDFPGNTLRIVEAGDRPVA
jgi:dipeptidyl aminopeptidase/acylaminoacyl peptidase